VLGLTKPAPFETGAINPVGDPIMCDEHTEESNEEFFRKQVNSRGAALWRREQPWRHWPPARRRSQTTAKGPMQVAEQEVRSPRRMACAIALRGAGQRQAPAVLVWPDIMGLRPRLPHHGQAARRVGLIRADHQPVLSQAGGQGVDAATEKSPTAVRTRLVALMGSTINAGQHKVDAIACISWLDKQKQVDTKKGVGTTGYCMGGPAGVPHHGRSCRTACAANAAQRPASLICHQQVAGAVQMRPAVLCCVAHAVRHERHGGNTSGRPCNSRSCRRLSWCRPASACRAS